MSDENEIDILERLERLTRLATLIRYLIGGALAIAAALVSVTIWVLTQEWTNGAQEAQLVEVRSKLGDHGGQIRGLEVWKDKYESIPRVSTTDVFNLEKRLQRVEDQSQMILETLRRIEGKL
jgi:hypothetical protein